MIQIWWPKIRLVNQDEFKVFLQGMANRLIQGYCRYGSPHRSKKYMTRLGKELKAYHKTGNMEHLINIANYAHLESYAPQNPKFHYDSKAPSATRREDV